MQPIVDVGLEVTRWLQQNYPWLDGLMTFITQMGRFEFYLAIAPILYWAVDKRMARNLIFLLAISDVVNGLAKHALRGPRPFWLEPAVERGQEESYGIPSGHAQTAFVAYIYLGAWFRQRWVWIASLLMVFLMGLSRVFLGVHFVHDVLAGYLLGLIIIVGYLLWERHGQERFRRRILGQRLLITITIPLVFGLLYAAILLLIGQPNRDVDWVSFIPDAEAVSVSNVISGLGTLLGIGAGFVLEASRVRFRTGGPIWQRIARVLVGFAGVLALWRGLALVFPTDPLWLGLPLRALRYFLLGIWSTYFGPMLFVYLRLAAADPPPGIDLSMRSRDPL